MDPRLSRPGQAQDLALDVDAGACKSNCGSTPVPQKCGVRAGVGSVCGPRPSTVVLHSTAAVVAQNRSSKCHSVPNRLRKVHSTPCAHLVSALLPPLPFLSLDIDIGYYDTCLQHTTASEVGASEVVRPCQRNIKTDLGEVDRGTRPLTTTIAHTAIAEIGLNYCYHSIVTFSSSIVNIRSSSHNGPCEAA